MTESIMGFVHPCESSVRISASVAEAVATMLERHSVEIPVIDEDDRLVGVVRSSDLLAGHAESIKDRIRPPRIVVSRESAPRDVAIMMNKVGADQALVTEGGLLVGILEWEDVQRLSRIR